MFKTKIYKKYYPVGAYTVFTPADENIVKEMIRRYKTERKLLEINASRKWLKTPFFNEHFDMECVEDLEYESLKCLEKFDRQAISVINYIILWNKYFELAPCVDGYRMNILCNSRMMIAADCLGDNYSLYIPIVKIKRVFYIKIYPLKMPEDIKRKIKKSTAKLIYIASIAETDKEIRDFYKSQMGQIELFIDSIIEEILYCEKSDNTNSAYVEMSNRINLIDDFLRPIYEEFDQIENEKKAYQKDIENAINSLGKGEAEHIPFMKLKIATKLRESEISELEEKYK